jgi:hypothetical protein
MVSRYLFVLEPQELHESRCFLNGMYRGKEDIYEILEKFPTFKPILTGSMLLPRLDSIRELLSQAQFTRKKF